MSHLARTKNLNILAGILAGSFVLFFQRQRLLKTQ